MYKHSILCLFLRRDINTKLFYYSANNIYFNFRIINAFQFIF